MKGPLTREDPEQRVRELEEELARSRNVEAVLRKSEEQFRTLAEGLHEALFRMSLADGRYEYISPAAKDVLGYSAEEILANPLLVAQVIHPDFRDYFKEQFGRLLAGEVPPTFEYKIVDADGKERWILQSNRGVFDDEGTLVAIEGLCRDVTEHRHAESLLRESEQRFRSLVETTSDWVWEIDKDGFYTYSSPKVEDLLGYRPDEVIGKRPFDLMPAGASQGVVLLFRELTKDHEPFSALENLNQRKDGRLVMLETSAVPVFDDNGVFLGYRGIDRNITERKRVEETLVKERERLQKALDEVRTLRGIVPICSNCKKIRDDRGYWNQIESYIRDHSEAEFSHGLCPDCVRKLFPQAFDD